MNTKTGYQMIHLQLLYPFLLFFGIVTGAPISGFSSATNTGFVKMYDSKKPNHVQEPPLRIGVIGLVHTHVHWILGREDYGDIAIVGIVEPNRELAKRYSEQYGYSMDMVYDTMEDLVKHTDPQAVTAFNTIYGHLQVVRFCAPRGIHVMVEKPLAVSMDHAREMAELAEKHGIELLTNYETSWYDTHAEAYRLIHEANEIGNLRKINFMTGHPGPIEIGCNSEFLEWLTDPILNGGGALTDFGCYGANLATWIMEGNTPLSVTCVTQQIKPHLYPKVEDEATILLTYPDVQVIIQASWNWSHNRKEMEVYGQTGYLICKNSEDMIIQKSEERGPSNLKIVSLKFGINDPFALLNDVVNGGKKLPPFDPSSLENNLIVMQILEAAKEASTTGKTIWWKDFFKN